MQDVPRKPSLADHIEMRLRQAQDGPVVSDWIRIDQARIDAFGLATDDDDPLHVDPEYAKACGPYGGTIAFGFLTLSLLTRLFRGRARHGGWGYELNYGFDRVRLVAPVPVGSRVRGVFRLKSARERGDDHVLFTYEATVEIDGCERPALSADWLGIWVNDGINRPAAGAP